MKRKRRYLLLKLERKLPLSEPEARSVVEEAVFDSLGEQGASKADARFRFFNAETQLALVACSLEETESVVAALALKRYFGGADVALRLQKVFGTLKKALPLFPHVKPSDRHRKPGAGQNNKE